MKSRDRQVILPVGYVARYVSSTFPLDGAELRERTPIKGIRRSLDFLFCYCMRLFPYNVCRHPRGQTSSDSTGTRRDLPVFPATNTAGFGEMIVRGAKLRMITMASTAMVVLSVITTNADARALPPEKTLTIRIRASANKIPAKGWYIKALVAGCSPDVLWGGIEEKGEGGFEGEEFRLANETDEILAGVDEGRIAVNVRVHKESICPDVLPSDSCLMRKALSSQTNLGKCLVTLEIEINHDDKDSLFDGFDDKPNIEFTVKNLFWNPPGRSLEAVRIEMRDFDSSSEINVTCQLERGEESFSLSFKEIDHNLTDTNDINPNSTSARGLQHLRDFSSRRIHILSTKPGVSSSSGGLEVSIHCGRAQMNLKPLTSIFDQITGSSNMNPPAFDRSMYHAQILENQPVGTPILQVRATDLDVGNGTRLTYSFTTETVCCCTLNQTTGEIRTKIILDREKVPLHEFEVHVSDGGHPPRNNSAKVVLKVLDLNDNPPIFTHDHYFFTMMDRSPVGTYVGTVTARDQDEGPNGHIFYTQITEEGHCCDLQVELFTGRISSLRVADAGRCKVHEFAIQARNPGFISYVYARVTVHVVEPNESSPVFLFPNGTTNDTTAIRYPPSRGTRVATVMVQPGDGPVDVALVDTLHVSGSSMPRRCLRNMFDFDPINGTVTLDPKCPKLPSRNSYFILKFKATYREKPYLTSTSNLGVVFADLDSTNMTNADKTPYFKSLVILAITFVLWVTFGIVAVVLVRRFRQRGRRPLTRSIPLQDMRVITEDRPIQVSLLPENPPPISARPLWTLMDPPVRPSSSEAQSPTISPHPSVARFPPVQPLPSTDSGASLDDQLQGLVFMNQLYDENGSLPFLVDFQTPSKDPVLPRELLPLNRPTEPVYINMLPDSDENPEIVLHPECTRQSKSTMPSDTNKHPETILHPNFSQQCDADKYPEAALRPDSSHRCDANEHPETVLLPNSSQQCDANEYPEAALRPDSSHQCDADGQPETLLRPDSSHQCDANEYPETVLLPDSSQQCNANEHPEATSCPDSSHQCDANEQPETLLRPDSSHQCDADEYPETVLLPDSIHRCAANEQPETMLHSDSNQQSKTEESWTPVPPDSTEESDPVMQPNSIEEPKFLLPPDQTEGPQCPGSYDFLRGCVPPPPSPANDCPSHFSPDREELKEMLHLTMFNDATGVSCPAVASPHVDKAHGNMKEVTRGECFSGLLKLSAPSWVNVPSMAPSWRPSHSKTPMVRAATENQRSDDGERVSPAKRMYANTDSYNSGELSGGEEVTSDGSQENSKNNSTLLEVFDVESKNGRETSKDGSFAMTQERVNGKSAKVDSVVWVRRLVEGDIVSEADSALYQEVVEGHLEKDTDQLEVSSAPARVVFPQGYRPLRDELVEYFFMLFMYGHEESPLVPFRGNLANSKLLIARAERRRAAAENPGPPATRCKESGGATAKAESPVKRADQNTSQASQNALLQNQNTQWPNVFNFDRWVYSQNGYVDGSSYFNQPPESDDSTSREDLYANLERILADDTESDRKSSPSKSESSVKEWISCEEFSDDSVFTYEAQPGCSSAPVKHKELERDLPEGSVPCKKLTLFEGDSDVFDDNMPALTEKKALRRRSPKAKHDVFTFDEWMWGNGKKPVPKVPVSSNLAKKVVHGKDSTDEDEVFEEEVKTETERAVASAAGRGARKKVSSKGEAGGKKTARKVTTAANLPYDEGADADDESIRQEAES